VTRRRHRRRCGQALRAGLLLGCLLASGAGAQTDTGPTAGVDQAIATAERSLATGDWRAAEVHYREALFEGWLLTGTLESLDGRLAEAREALRTASSFAHEDPALLQSLASAQLQLGEAAPAAEILTRLAEKDPRDVGTRRLLARALAADGRPAEAMRRLDEAIATAPDDPEMVFLLAAEYLWLKEVQTAERLFAEVARSRPIPQTRVLIGRAYRDAGEYERARIELHAALRQDPGVRRAHYYLGMVALADAKTAEPLEAAQAEFREELKLAPEDPLTSDQLGLALLDAARPRRPCPCSRPPCGARRAARSSTISGAVSSRSIDLPKPRPRCGGRWSWRGRRGRATPSWNKSTTSSARRSDAGALRRRRAGISPRRGVWRRGGATSRRATPGGVWQREQSRPPPTRLRLEG
jgi:tetratricopeptide (TPR) repeat protein